MPESTAGLPYYPGQIFQLNKMIHWVGEHNGKLLVILTNGETWRYDKAEGDEDHGASRYWTLVATIPL